MAEDILKQEAIAQYLADLIADVRDLKRRLKVKDREEELGVAEEPQDAGGALPFTTGDHLVPTCKVTTLIDDTTFGVVRQIPADSSVGWMDDPELSNVLSIKIPPNLTLPKVDDYVQPTFTGAFQQFTAGTTVSIPRYGLFGAGGGEVDQYLVKEEFDDYIRCRTWASSVEGSDNVYIAKPFANRRTPFDGVSSGGRSYAYSGSNQRVVTLVPSVAPGSESQVVVPEYQTTGPITSVIYGARLKTPTDVVVTISGTPTNLDILDINVDARAWVGEAL